MSNHFEKKPPVVKITRYWVVSYEQKLSLYPKKWKTGDIAQHELHESIEKLCNGIEESDVTQKNVIITMPDGTEWNLDDLIIGWESG